MKKNLVSTILQALVSLEKENWHLGVMYSSDSETWAALDKSPSFLVL